MYNVQCTMNNDGKLSIFLKDRMIECEILPAYSRQNDRLRAGNSALYQWLEHSQDKQQNAGSISTVTPGECSDEGSPSFEIKTAHENKQYYEKQDSTKGDSSFNKVRN